MRPLSHVTDDAMKCILSVSLPAVLIGMAGCTANHYHYYGSPAPAVAAESPGLQVVEKRLEGIHQAMEAVASNLANLNTLGYKARQPRFIEGQPTPDLATDWTQGEAMVSNRPLDLYIAGDGFFKIDLPAESGGGSGYTRVGNFFLSADGDLVLGNSEGPRLANSVSIDLEAISLNIEADGAISQLMPDGTVVAIGQIELWTFVSRDGLKRTAGGLFLETEASGPPIAHEPGEGVAGTLQQNMLEGSNVVLLSEILEFEKLNRWGESLAKQMGESALQAHTLSAASQGAVIAHQVDLKKQLDEALSRAEAQEF